MAEVSLIITTKNEEKVLPDLLESIGKQTYKGIETIVVDNDSTDKTRDIAKRFGAKIFEKGPERSAQRNYGVKMATGKSVVILDADMILTPTVIKECVEKISDDNLGAVIIPERSFGVGFWTRFKVFEREFYVGEDSIEGPRFYQKRVFEKFGGYDTTITGPEDWDLPLRMKKAGIKFGRIKSFILHNERNFSPLKSAKKKFYYAAGGGEVYLKRHPDVALSHGNLVFRGVYFRKWKKLLSHPILSLGMFFVRGIEMAGALAGLLYGLKYKYGTKR